MPHHVFCNAKRRSILPLYVHKSIGWFKRYTCGCKGLLLLMEGLFELKSVAQEKKMRQVKGGLLLVKTFARMKAGEPLLL